MTTRTEQDASQGPAGSASGTGARSSRTGGRVIALPGLPALPSLPSLPSLRSLPGIQQLSWLRPQIKLPSRERVLLYAGLGAMAAIELIDWPVALAIAAAQALGQSHGERALPATAPPRGPRAEAAPAASQPAATSELSAESKPARRSRSDS